MNHFICFRETWRHHSAMSGFDPLFIALEHQTDGKFQNYFFRDETSCDIFFGLFRGLSKVLNLYGHLQKPVNQPPSPFVTRLHEIIGAKVIRCAERSPDALVFLSAGENQYGANFISSNESVRKRIVICLHQPPSWFRLHWHDFSLFNGLGAIICLSHEQKEFISQVCKTPTLLIHHGVRHDFFRPSDSIRGNSSARLLFVGHWLRDFETLANAMQLVWHEQPEVGLDCVIPYGYRDHPALIRLARDHRVRWYADLTHGALRDLYQQSSLLFLPLVDAVANNSIIEAMASGLPIVTTAVGGVIDYIPESAGELCRPYDASAHAQAALSWLRDHKRLENASKICRIFAVEQLDWELIAKKLLLTFKNLGFNNPVNLGL
jgi:glycosyltransferase involved in cell wall biosynthesis